MPGQDAILRLVLDTQALLRQLSDVVREWTASTSRMNRAAEGVDFDLAQREARELEEIVRQMAAGVVSNLAKVEAAAAKAGTQGLGKTGREAKQVETAIARLTASADRELAKLERAARRVELQRLRKEAKEAEDAIVRMARDADRELRKVEKAADRIQFRRAREEAKAAEQAIKTLEQSGARSFRALEQRAEAAGVKLQTGIGGALTRLPPQVQALQRRFEAALTAMRTAADRVSFQKAQSEAQRLEAAIHRMGLSAQRDLDRIRQSAQRASGGLSQFGGVASNLNRILGSLGIFLSARVLLQWGRDAVNASVRLEAFRAQLAASVSTVDEANELFEFANDQTERLGLNFASVVEGTARFAAATKNTNLTLEQRKEVLLSVFEAARVLNLSEQRLSNTLLALEQIASKATVSMEELRRQLGDNIPGAVAILAKEMGVTQERLLRMIETNQVLSTEALPLLAKGFRETFGSGTQAAIDTTAAKLGRLQKQVFDLKVAFVEGFEQELVAAVDDLSASLSESEDDARSFGAVVAKVFRGLQTEISQTAKVVEGVKAVFNTDELIRQTLFEDIPESAARAVEGIESVGEEIANLDRVLLEAFDASELGSLEVATASLQAAFNELARSGSTLADLQHVNAEAHDLLLAAFNRLVDRYREDGGELSDVFLSLARSIGVTEKALASVLTPAEELQKKIRDAVAAVESAPDPFSRAADAAREYRDRLYDLVEGVDLENVSEEQARALLEVANALEETARKADEARTSLFGTEKAADALAQKLRDVVDGLDLDSLTAEQASKIRDLIEEVVEAFDLLDKELDAGIVSIIEKFDALGFGLTGVRSEIEKLTAELEQALSEVDLDNLNPEQLELFKDKIQEVLDKWALYGEEAPPHIQAVADKLGVTTSIVEKELEKQEKAAEKAAKAEEQAAKRRIDALEQIGAAFLKLSKTLGESAGENEEIANLEKQLKELEDQRFNFTGPLEDLDELNAEIANMEARLDSLREGQAETGESAQKMADEINDAISGLIDKLGPVYARLDETQRTSVQSILERLQAMGESGVASSEDVSAALSSMIQVMESAGQPTADLRSALAEIEQGGLDIGKAFEALREEIAQSNEEFKVSGEELEKSELKVKQQVDRMVNQWARLNRAHESTFNNINERMRIGLGIWEEWIAACERLKSCLTGAGR